MKILIFAKTEQEARKAAWKHMSPDNQVGWRSADSFNAEKPEKCDLAVVLGEFPEITAAYEGAEKKAKGGKRK